MDFQRMERRDSLRNYIARCNEAAAGATAAVRGGGGGSAGRAV